MEHQSRKNHPIQPKQSDVRQSPSIISDTLDVSSVQGVLNLQRTIGNQAVQQLINKQGVDSSIQRADEPEDTSQANQESQTGLANEDRMNNYASSIHAYVNNPDNATKSLNNLLKVFQKEIKHILTDLSIPMPEVTTASLDGQYARFTNQPWEITLGIDGFGNAQTIGDIQPDAISEAVNSMYHETRHAEQFFRVGRMIAGEQLPQNAKKAAKKAVAKNIAEQMSIPLEVAKQVVEQPLHEAIGDPEFEEAKMWYRIMYGEDKKYRVLIQKARYDILPTVAKETEFIVQAIKKQIPSDYDALPDDEKQAIDQQVQPELNDLQTYLDMLKTLDQPVAKELDRLSNIPANDRTGYDAVMTITLENIQTFLNAISYLKPITIKELDEVHPLVDEALFKEIEKAIKELPTEADAYATGDAVQKMFDNLGT